MLEIPNEIWDMIFDYVGGAENYRDNIEMLNHFSLTFALFQRPCTEEIPWQERVMKWDMPCPYV